MLAIHLPSDLTEGPLFQPAKLLPEAAELVLLFVMHQCVDQVLHDYIRAVLRVETSQLVSEYLEKSVSARMQLHIVLAFAILIARLVQMLIAQVAVHVVAAVCPVNILLHVPVV